MSDHLDQFLYDAPDTEIRAEIIRLQDRVADLELDNEGLTRLIDSYKRVEVMSRRGYVLVRGQIEVPVGGKTATQITDLWVKGSLREPAGSFDRDVADEIRKAYEEAPR